MKAAGTPARDFRAGLKTDLERVGRSMFRVLWSVHTWRRRYAAERDDPLAHRPEFVRVVAQLHPFQPEEPTAPVSPLVTLFPQPARLGPSPGRHTAPTATNHTSCRLIMTTVGLHKAPHPVGHPAQQAESSITCRKKEQVAFGTIRSVRPLDPALLFPVPPFSPSGMLRKKKVVPRFVGGKMTPELSAALPHLSSLSSAQSRGVLKLVIDHIKGADYKPADAEDMAGSLGVDVSGLRRPE